MKQKSTENKKKKLFLSHDKCSWKEKNILKVALVFLVSFVSCVNIEGKVSFGINEKEQEKLPEERKDEWKVSKKRIFFTKIDLFVGSKIEIEIFLTYTRTERHCWLCISETVRSLDCGVGNFFFFVVNFLENGEISKEENNLSWKTVWHKSSLFFEANQKCSPPIKLQKPMTTKQNKTMRKTKQFFLYKNYTLRKPERKLIKTKIIRKRKERKNLGCDKQLFLNKK